MPRTTSTLVGGIIELDTDIDVTPFIDVANQLVTEICEPAGLDVTRLTSIETWLAAHFYAQRDPRASSEGAGPVNISYQSIVALGLSNTHYGQMAMLLDTSGGLTRLNKGKRKGKVIWLGTEREEQEVE